MDLRDRVRLKKNCRSLVEDLQVEDILDYLYQESVLSENDCERIRQKGTRRDQGKQLLSVLPTKGPQAYQIFRLALMAEQRHLAELLDRTPVSESDVNGVAGSHPVDPGDDAVLKDIQAELRLKYEEIFTRTEPIPWVDEFVVSLADIYTDLVVCEKDVYHSFSCNRALKKESIKVENLFKDSTGSRPTRVYIEGVAGIGKSSLCKKLAYSWSRAQGSDHALSHFRILILLELKPLQPGTTVLEAAFTQLFPEDFKHNRFSVLECIERHQDHMLFVLDGYDELPAEYKPKLLKYLGGGMFHRASCLVTSRPVKISGRLFDLRLRCRGFTNQNAQSFVCKYFKGKPLRFFKELVNQMENNDYLLELIQNPFNTLLLCIIWEDYQGQLPKSLTQLFKEIIYVIIRRYCSKNNIPVRYDDIPEQCNQLLNEIQDIAFDGVMNNKRQFSEVELDLKSRDKDLYKVGFLYKRTQQSKLRSCAFYTFPHRNVQEMLAAMRMPRLEFDTVKESFDSFLLNRPMSIMCIFTIGLLKEDEEKTMALFKSLASFAQRQEEKIEVQTYQEVDGKEVKMEYFFNRNTRPFSLCLHCLNEVDKKEHEEEVVRLVADCLPSDLYLDLKCFQNHFSEHIFKQCWYSVLENMPSPRAIMITELVYFSESDIDKCAHNVFQIISHIAKTSEDQFDLFIYCDGLNFRGYSSLPYILNIFTESVMKDGGTSSLRKKVKAINFLLPGISSRSAMFMQEAAQTLELTNPHSAQVLPPINVFVNCNKIISPFEEEPYLMLPGVNLDVELIKSNAEEGARNFKQANPHLNIQLHRASIPTEFLGEIY